MQKTALSDQGLFIICMVCGYKDTMIIKCYALNGKIGNIAMRIMPSVLLVFSVGLFHAPLWAQSTWRCPGNYYTNNDLEAKKIGECVVVTKPISVIPAPEPVQAPPSTTPPDSKDPNSKDPNSKDPDTATDDLAKQRKNDRTRQKIAQTKQELNDLKQEYNGGEPIKIGPEHRNHQKYLDRVEQLKKDIQSKENEIKELEKQIEE